MKEVLEIVDLKDMLNKTGKIYGDKPAKYENKKENIR